MRISMIDQKNSKPPIEEYELHWTKKLLLEAICTIATALMVCGLIFALVLIGSSEPTENMSDYAKQKAFEDTGTAELTWRRLQLERD